MDAKFRKLSTSLVLQVFWDDNVSVVKNAVFPDGSSLSAQTYSSLADVQKFISIKPFILSRSVNNRWKDQKVFYNSCICPPIIFPLEQSQICTYWPLLAVKSYSASVPKFFILRFSWWIQGWLPVMALQHHDGAFIIFLLVSTSALYLWLLNCAGITLEPHWAPLNVSVNLSSPSVHQGAPDRVAPPIGSTKPIVNLIILLIHVCIQRSVTLLDLNMALSTLKDTAVVLASFPIILNPCVEAKSQVSSD
jgi:hypothetical protein